MSKRTSKKESSYTDDKLPNQDGADVSLKAFGDIQMYFYLFSCMGMIFYFTHFALTEFCGVTIGISRSYTHGLLEVFLLVTRTANEVYYDKIGLGDWGHHIAMLYGFYLVTYVNECMVYDWLVCHMQCLHFPCLCWYLGCRKNSYLEKYLPNRSDLKEISARMFPWLMVSTAGYRLSIMALSSYHAYQNKKYFSCGIIGLVGSLLAYLDKGWGTYFLHLLGWPSNSLMVIMYVCGVLGGIYTTSR